MARNWARMASRPQVLKPSRAAASERLHVRAGGGDGVAVLVAALGDEGVGEVEEVLPLVALLGDRRVEAQALAVAGRQRLCEARHLRAEVVHVELACHVVADEGEDAAERVAVGRVTSVTHVQRAGGVHAHELHVHLRARLGGQGAAPVVRALREHTAHGAGVPGVGEEEVEEARSGHLHAFAEAGPGAGQPALAEGGRQIARGHSGLLGTYQRRVGGQVTVLGPCRDGQLHGRRRGLRLAGLGQHVRQGPAQRRGEAAQVEEIVSHASHPLRGSAPAGRRRGCSF